MGLGLGGLGTKGLGLGLDNKGEVGWVEAQKILVTGKRPNSPLNFGLGLGLRLVNLVLGLRLGHFSGF